MAAILQVDPHGTLNFLIEKNSNDYHELLGRYISMIDDEIQSASTTDEITKLCPNPEELLNSHIGAIHDSKIIEIDDIISTVNAKCKTIGLQGIAQNVSFIEPTSIPNRFIQLFDLFKNQNYLQCAEISTITGFPADFVNEACSIEDYTPIQSSTEATQKDYVQSLMKDKTNTLRIAMDISKFRNPSIQQRGLGYIDSQIK